VSDITTRSTGFTLPGEAGHESLCLKLAETWNADAIRDSDGTELSPALLSAGYEIYSTVCVIREHNAWLAAHPECRQQTVLCTPAQVQTDQTLTLPLMASFFAGQFELNDTPESRKHWQVYDRTSNTLLPANAWTYADGRIRLAGTAFHKYTASFFAYRIWEEISMYNHLTNGWQKERLAQIDPVREEAAQHLYAWMDHWCRTHPDTDVVRFTSLFYNFAWIWGANKRNRHLFTDWSGYDFTVSPQALSLFTSRYGYTPVLEDFINKNLRHSGHFAPNRHKRDWMRFIGEIVLERTLPLIQTVRRHGKKAFVFYDDSWIGLEPNAPAFARFGFDGIIKCVFSGFEARLCANAACNIHEIRLHPYLFPVGLGGAPTFSQGGNPAGDALRYWSHVRRALLRQPVDRIGLGGYLHLAEDFPDFIQCVKTIADEFRAIRDWHAQGGTPVCLKPRVAVLSAYGALRAWTLSGHMHETDGHDLIHVLESLSGLPFNVSFIDFEQITAGVPGNVDVLLCAGRAGTGWSGAEGWTDDAVASVTRFVHEGGAVLGIGEPSALAGYDTYLRLSPILGVDVDDGRYACHGQWQFEVNAPAWMPDGSQIPVNNHVRLLDAQTCVLAVNDGIPQLTCRSFGAGKGLYMASFRYSCANTRLLQNLILCAAGEPVTAAYIADNPVVDCAWFPDSGMLVLANSTMTEQKATVYLGNRSVARTLPPMALTAVPLGREI
jgi:1,3-beta-galactosyl-N-acetylhexosamine phosphorylase